MTPSHGTGKAGAHAVRPGRDGSGSGQVARIQRARVVAAMVSVASERGSTGATVALVVGRSRVSRRTFYELFEDWEDCFVAALEDSIAAASRCVLDAYNPSAPWQVRIRAALTALLEFLEDEPDMARLMIVEALGAGPRTLDCRSLALAPLIAAIDEGRREANGISDATSSLVAEGVVGAVLSVLHTRLSPPARGVALPVLALASPLMSMIVLPYLGPAASRRELAQPTPARKRTAHASSGGDPLRDVSIRITHRTICVLSAIAAAPGASNRQIADAAGIADQGQISKLLTRLQQRGLLANHGNSQTKGARNAWTLTPKGEQVERAVRTPACGSDP